MPKSFGTSDFIGHPKAVKRQNNTFPVEVLHKGKSESELFECFPQFGLFDFQPPLALPKMQLVVSLDQGGRSKLSIFSQVLFPIKIIVASSEKQKAESMAIALALF